MNTDPNQAAASPARLHLPEDEARLFEYLDGQCLAEEARAVRVHLASCAECQALRQQWRRLDSQLAIGLEGPALSNGFATRLMQQIDTEAAPPLAALALVQKRVRLEAEWQRCWIEHRKSFLRSVLPALLDYAGYAVALGVAGYLLFGLLNHILKTLVNAPAAPSYQFALPIACGIGAVLFFAAVAFSTKAGLRRWLAEL